MRLAKDIARINEARRNNGKTASEGDQEKLAAASSDACNIWKRAAAARGKPLIADIWKSVFSFKNNFYFQ